jgi:8-oxo-dGTP diphosphatase
MVGESDWAASLARKWVAATVLFTDAAGRVLVVEPTYKPGWELPGGSVEGDESPRHAAEREIVEELGVEHCPGRVLVIDYVPAAPGRTEGVVTVFEGGVLDESMVAAIQLPDEELRSFAFVELDGLERFLPSRLARRAAAAMQARYEGRTLYLEDGYPITG